MHSSPKPPANHTVGSELLDAVVRLNRWANRHAAWPIPMAQARVLSQIDGLSQACVSDLARVEHCSQPTMTVQVHRLQQQGLVTRTPAKEDARISWITLTPKGREALAQARGARATIVNTLITQLSTEDRRGLQNAVQALSRLLAVAYPQEPPSSTPEAP